MFPLYAVESGIDPAWAIIPTLLVGLGFLIRTARLDRAKRDDTSWQQWKQIAEAMAAEKLLVQQESGRLIVANAQLLTEKVIDATRIARLEAEIAFLKITLRLKGDTDDRQ